MFSPSKLPLARAVVRRLALAIEWRIDERVGALGGHVEEQVADLDRRIRTLEEQSGTVERRLDDELTFAVDEMRCIGPQIASLEERVEDLRVSDGRTPMRVPRSGELTEAEAEHARVRARLAAVSLFEERLRRLEAAGSDVPSPEARGAVSGT